MGDGSSHSARVAAWGLIGKHLGMFDRRQLDDNGEPAVRQLFTISIGNGPSPTCAESAVENKQINSLAEKSAIGAKSRAALGAGSNGTSKSVA
jgi:hypothetical protein